MTIHDTSFIFQVLILLATS